MSVRLRLLPLHMARTVVVIRLCAVVSGSARWWLSMLIADSDMFPAASQAVIRLLVHFKKKKFMVSSGKVGNGNVHVVGYK